ncbi:MAG: ChbG/HpnK family deacetylase [Bacteroidales bacterium]|nr:ChbG/HpnK family deacetylase [Bacteroidales bacterium]
MPDGVRAQAQGKIRLIIRGDDIGSSHAANLGCIESYRNGIMRTVEVMVPCPWFPEAVKLLRENPGLDVGVHLTITSEWSNYKWRPLTCVPSLVDSLGYFFPMIWPNPNFPAGSAIREHNWKLEDIEREWRAQIETAKRLIPQVSHISCHMGCSDIAPEVRELFKRLAKEYGLEINPADYGVKALRGWGEEKDFSKRLAIFLKALENLTPGTWLFVDHPALNQPEMETIGHPGYEDVGKDRDMVVKIFTHPDVKKMISKKGIELAGYNSLK